MRFYMKRALSLCALIAFFGTAAVCETFSVDPSDAFFSVVTHKAGMASAMAHDHLIYAEEFNVEMTGTRDDVSTARFKLRFPVTALRLSTQEISKRWYPKIHALGAQKKPFTKTSDSSEKLILKHMLAKGQLNAAKFPEIKAELKNLKPRAAKKGEKKFNYDADVALTVAGHTVKHTFAAHIQEIDGRARIKAIGSYKFTEFSIKPYSGLFGMVRNMDQFYVFVSFTATPDKRTKPR